MTNSLGLVLFLAISPGGIPGREDREEVEKAYTIIKGDIFRCELSASPLASKSSASLAIKSLVN